jgi:U3 small nucleolar RNA-associated protein 13
MSKSLISNYGVDRQVESFFTGTQIIFDQSGEHFYCSHGPVVNKVSVEDGQVKAQITTKNEGDNVIKFALSSDDKLLVVAYYSGLIAKYNLVDDTLEREFKSIHSAPIAQLKIDPTNTLLATASSDGTIKLWNLQNHYCSHNLKGINGVVSAIEFHAFSDRELLISSAGDDCIHIFDLATSTRIAKLSKHCSTITDLKITPDGKRMVSVGRDKIAVIWCLSKNDDYEFGQAIRTIPLFESMESVVLVHATLLNPLPGQNLDEDQMIFVTIGEEGQIKFWDAQSGSKILTQNQEPLCQDRSPSIACFQISTRPKSDQLCVVSVERDLFFYELPTLKLTQQLQGHLDEILSVCWFVKDQYLAIACNSNDLKIMEVATSRCQHLKGHSDIVVCVKSMPCDPLCIISSSKDCSIIVWKFEPETMSPQIIYTASGHTHAIYAIGVSPYEKIFFSGGEDTTLKKWTIPVKKKDGSNTKKSSSLIANQTIKAHEARIDAIDVSPNEQLVATGSRDKTAKIFSASNLQIIATLKGHRRGVNAVQFSPVDQVIVTAADFSLRMWNLQDFTCVKTFQGHDCTVLNFSFLSTGLQMLSIGSDGNVKFWNCKLNECMKTIDAHSGNAWSLSLTKDDGRLVTGGDDEKLIIWRDTTEEEREERLANLQTQVMQEQDFMNYINKKKWRKALKMALKMENQNKTLTVMREILLEPDGSSELEEILARRSLDQVDFIIECCLSWTATAKNSSLGQLVLNIIFRRFDNQQLLRLNAFKNSMDQLKTLTEKSFNRCERLVQQATFVDFFMNSMRIQ